jgi:hypothetical protein
MDKVHWMGSVSTAWRQNMQQECDRRVKGGTGGGEWRWVKVKERWGNKERMKEDK